MPKRLSAGRPTLRDMEDFLHGKYNAKKSRLNWGVALGLLAGGLVFLIIAYLSDPQVPFPQFVQSTWVNLASGIIGSDIAFVVLGLFWEKRLAALEKREEEVKQATEKMSELWQKVMDDISKVMASSGLTETDLEAPEAQDMPFPDAVKYLKERKRSQSSENKKQRNQHHK